MNGFCRVKCAIKHPGMSETLYKRDSHTGDTASIGEVQCHSLKGCSEVIIKNITWFNDSYFLQPFVK